MVTHTQKQCFWTRVLQNPMVPKITVGGSWNAAKNSKYLNIVDIFTGQLAILEKSPCATNCLLSFFHFHRQGFLHEETLGKNRSRGMRLCRSKSVFRTSVNTYPKITFPKTKLQKYKYFSLFWSSVCLTQVPLSTNEKTFTDGGVLTEWTGNWSCTLKNDPHRINVCI